jgi:hypothetical protein
VYCLSSALNNGSPYLILACIVVFAGVVVGFYSRRGSGIDAHPYTKSEQGGELGSDMPPESIGRPEMEPLLWPKRAGHHPHRDDPNAP